MSCTLVCFGECAKSMFVSFHVNFPWSRHVTKYINMSIQSLSYSMFYEMSCFFHVEASFWSWLERRSSLCFRLIVPGPNRSHSAPRINVVYFGIDGNIQLPRKLYLSISLAWIFNGRLTQSSVILQEWPVPSPLQIDCVFSFTYL